MRQVVQSLRDGSIQVPEVPEPVLRPGGVLVRTLVSVISPGTESASLGLSRTGWLARARQRPDLVRQVLQSAGRDGLRATIEKVRARLDSPKAPGYALAGQVLAVGDGVDHVRPGDAVACAGEGWASHAEIVWVPRRLVARVPPGLDAESAAFGTLGAIALHGVRQTGAGLGETVAVIGLGLIGQIAAQLLRLSGAHVIGVDVAAPAVARARHLGLTSAWLRSDPVEPLAQASTSGIGVDAVLITAASAGRDPIDLAGRLCRDRGRVVILGAVRADLPRESFYGKEIEVRMSRSYGPGRYDPGYEVDGHDYPVGHVRWTEERNLQSFLDLAASGALRLSDLVTHRFPVAEAAAAYELLLGEERADAAAVLLTYPASRGAAWPEAIPARAESGTRVSIRPASTTPPRPLRLGLIGAGRFARATLVPVLRRRRDLTLMGVATAHPHTARHAAEALGFGFATTEARSVIADPDTNAIVVATRHDTHAALAHAALDAGRAVFVEKPLALDDESLDEVLAAARRSRLPLVVGFNRRRAPLLVRLRAALPSGLPRVVALRVNAGPLPADHWLRDPRVGGGRVIGEGCHFADLALHLVEAPLTSVRASGTADDFVATFAFADGSVASLVYTAAGNPSLAKERIEVFAGGVAAVLDDYRRLELHRPGHRRQVWRARGAPRGHAPLLEAFLDAVGGGSPPPMTLSEIEAAHRATFDMARQLSAAGV